VWLKLSKSGLKKFSRRRPSRKQIVEACEKARKWWDDRKGLLPREPVRFEFIVPPSSTKPNWMIESGSKEVVRYKKVK